jgi:hypothetical protein
MSKTPFRLILLIWLLLFFNIWNLIQIWTALTWREILDKYSRGQISSILAFSGGFWFIIGTILVWGIWRNQGWTKKLLIGSSLGYGVWYWTDRLVFQNPHPNWLFAVILNLAIIIFIIFTMKSLAREAYERKIENPKIER